MVGSEDVAYALERKLFVRGCLVHVLAGTDVSSAARPSTDAGLISICVLEEEDIGAREQVKHAVGSDRFLAVSAAENRDPEGAADEICRTLEDRGYIKRQPKPFTGGAGI
jgi:hypothetical protein